MGDVPTGGIAVRLLDGRVLEARCDGFLTPARVAAAQREIDRLVAPLGEPVDMLVDTLAIDAFAPGLPALGLRWFQAHRARVGRIALVAQRTLFIGVAHAIFRLANLPVTVHATRDEAIAALRPPPGKKPPRSRARRG